MAVTSQDVLAAALVALSLLGFAGVAPAEEPKPVRGLPLTLEYDRDLADEDKLDAAHGTASLLAGLGIHLAFDATTVDEVVRASGGRIHARPVGDADRLYDAVYYLTDVARLPSGTWPLFRRIVVVDDLSVEDARSGKRCPAALVLEPSTSTIVADHSNLNRVETFGNFMHPKVNHAMVLQVAIEAELMRMGEAALAELGLDIVVDDEEWARLNGPAGWSVYTGEDVSFVGGMTALRLTPPGIVVDAIREARSGVPANAYHGLPDPTQPWWSPRHGPAADRQNILRCLLYRGGTFFDRLTGRSGIEKDRILFEKTRLILYAAFVASRGALDHDFWMYRHPDNPAVDELTRDFDDAFLGQLQARLDRGASTSGVHLAR